jgi:hypothetical protein
MPGLAAVAASLGLTPRFPLPHPPGLVTDPTGYPLTPR